MNTLPELQDYLRAKAIERGFSKDPKDQLLFLAEEVGELAKAVRGHINLGFSDTTTRADVQEEIADVQIVLTILANMLDVDIAEAVRSKEAKNEHRQWTKR